MKRITGTKGYRTITVDELRAIYANAINARENAMTEGDWYEANKKVKNLEKVLDRLH